MLHCILDPRLDCILGTQRSRSNELPVRISLQSYHASKMNQVLYSVRLGIVELNRSLHHQVTRLQCCWLQIDMRGVVNVVRSTE